MKLGKNGITTDHPGAAREWLGKRGEVHPAPFLFVLLLFFSGLPSARAAELKNYAVNGGFEAVDAVSSFLRGDFAKAGVKSGESIPLTWQIHPGWNKGVAFNVTSGPGNVRSGNYALHITEGTLATSLGQFGVLQTGELAIKMWVKGPGRVSIGMIENYPVGDRTFYDVLVAPDDPNRSDWTEYTARYTPSLSTRMFTLHLSASPPEVFVDDVQVLAPSGVLTPVPDLSAPVVHDQDTLFLLNFDAPFPEDTRFQGKAAVVEGRFGKGIRIPSESSIRTYLSGRIKREQGTVEFWIRPDFEGSDNLQHPIFDFGMQTQYFLIRSQYNHILFGAYEAWKGIGFVMSPPWRFAANWGKGFWHHVAATWSEDTWQIFVDGILVDAAKKYPEETEVPGNTSFWKAIPSGLGGDIVIGSPGMVLDEIRISSTVRYGFPPQSKPASATSVTGDKTVSRQEVKTDTWQPKLPAGDIFFEASPSTVFLDENNNARMLEEKVDGAQVLVLYDENDMAAWKLSGIGKGEYAIGLIADDCEKITQSPNNVYLNGRPIIFDTGSEPYLLKDGTPLSEWRTGQLVKLQDGDQIRLNGQRHIVRLNLYRQVPARGVRNVRLELSPVDDFFRLGSTMSAPDDKSLKGDFRARNITGRKVKVTLTAKIYDYEMRPIFSKEFLLELDNNEAWKNEWSAERTGASLYRLRLFARGENGETGTWTETILTDVAGGWRPRLVMERGWELAAQAEELKYLKYDTPRKSAHKVFVPSYWYPLDQQRNKEHVAWYRRTFTMFPAMKGKRSILHFDQVNYECQVYVNGKKAGEHFGPYDPFEIDVTDFAQEGENIIEVGVRDWIAALSPAALERSDLTWPMEDWRQTDAPGTSNAGGQPWDRSGISGDVYLEGRGATYASEIRTLTSYRHKFLGARLVINNTGAVRTITVENAVYYLDNKVLELPAKTLEVSRDSKMELEVEGKWENPVLWQMEDPKLCVLVTTLKERSETIDVSRTRFGFAEWWPDGKYLMLNGTPQKLRSAHVLDQWGWDHFRFSFITDELNTALLFGNTNFRRWEGSIRVLEYADEIGFANRVRVPDVGHPSVERLQNDTYWKNAEKFTRATVRGLMNHPSVAAWEASNEFACFAGYTDLPDGQKVAVKRLIPLHKTILSEDPQGWVESDSDGDLLGAGQSWSLHYPLDQGFFSGEKFDGHSFYFPEDAYWRPYDLIPKKDELIPIGNREAAQFPSYVRGKLTFGEKPVGCGETCWTSFFLGAHGSSMVGGERVFEDDKACIRYGYNLLTKYFMEGYRDIEMAYLYPWRAHYEWVNVLTLPSIAAVSLNKNSSFVSDTKPYRKVNLHNDTEQTRVLSLLLVMILDGKETILASETRTIGPAELARVEVTLNIPEVAAVKRGTLSVRVNEGEHEHYREDFPCVLYPAIPQAPKTTGVYLYDPAEISKKAFRTINATLKPVTGLPPGDATGLVIADNALQDFLKVVKPLELQARIAKGLKVIVLHQEEVPEGMPFEAKTVKSRWTSISYSRSPAHPALAEIAESQLSFWADGHVVSRGDFYRPQHGNVRVIVDAGGAEGLTFVPMMEIFVGKGSYLLSQMLLTEKVPVEPTAAKILVNLIAYAADSSAARTFCELGMAAGPSTKLRLKLDEMTVRYIPLDISIKPPEKLPEIIGVDGNQSLSVEWCKALKEHLFSGGTLWISRIGPQTKVQFEEITGKRLAVYPLRLAEYRGRLVKTRPDAPLLTGISNYEICWVRAAMDEASPLQDPVKVIAEPLEYECRLVDDENQTTALLTPSALVDFPAGKGRVVIDQIRWMENVGAAAPQAAQVASALLTNLNIEIPSVPDRLKMPADVALLPFDLVPYANRALADDIADDGKGGWSDQGSQFDMRHFPAGPIRSQEIPFAVASGTKSCIVLKSKMRSPDSDAPASVSIPIGRKLAGAYFLHSGAWISSGIHQASYLVRYEDSTEYEIPLIGGRNIRDWSADPAQSFIRESNTRTWVAWSGRGAIFENTSLYVTEWVNPKMEVTVEDILFISKEEGVPILLALTLAFPPVAVVEVPKPEATTMTDSQRKQVNELLDAGKTAEAVKVLDAILGENPSRVDAHKMIARIAWNEKRYEEAEKHYLTALEYAGESVEILNLLGQLNREWERPSRALEFYRRSLKVNLNQPDVINAVRSLEEILQKQ